LVEIFKNTENAQIDATGDGGASSSAGGMRTFL